MTPARQILLATFVLAAAGGFWILRAPEARPWLARVGLEELSRAPQDTSGPSGPRAGPMAVEVVLRPALEEATSDEVMAIGDGRAIRSVSLMPEVTGRVTSIPVGPGQLVAAGDTILTLDDDVQKIALERARLMRADAETAATRAETLRSLGAAADLQRIAAALALETAELELREAQIALEKRTIRAPIGGRVGFIAPEVGDHVTSATEITRIDDRSAILVDFRLPERFVNRVAPGDPLDAHVLSGEGGAMAGRVHAVDNRIDPASRSFRIQAAIANDSDLLRSGMALSIAMAFPGAVRIAVDPLAIRWDAGGSFVWVARAGRAEIVPVRIIQRMPGRVLIDGAIAPGESVVVEGVQTLNPGDPVVPVDEGAPAAARAAAATGAARPSDL